MQSVADPGLGQPPPESGRREAADAAATRPKDGVIAGAPLSGADLWMEVFAPHLPVDRYSYNPTRLAESLGRADEPYIRDRARAILTKLLDDNIRNQLRKHISARPRPTRPVHPLSPSA